VTVALLSLVAFSGQVAQASAEPPPLAPRETGYAHVEIDLSRARLSVVDGSGRVVKTLPVSSGSGKLFTSEGRTRRAITPRGRFTVFRKIEGWHKSPLGMLYYPSYITHGVAIHGSSSVPPRPASHGCIRIPMSAAKEFFDVTPIGTVVLVH
jgi:cell wall hydrolase